MAEAIASASAADLSDRVTSHVAEEELLRARLYSLLSRLLAAAPDAWLLAGLKGTEGDSSELGNGLAALAREAASTSAADAKSEYHDLFIGIGRGELVPYGSYYLTGFLNEKPLAELREALSGLGIARDSSVKEPEDHIAALCEVMAGLINGAFGVPAPLVVQRRFFDRHVAPWAARFFADLEGAETARFYRAVGRIGRLFVGIETTAFAMVYSDEFDGRAT
ncbi:MAG TPA: molecular chaperone TorD family protein [Stellaceae bacterium]|nr:molecular chaperone TorD family protein [Stellaceae bacterium]